MRLFGISRASSLLLLTAIAGFAAEQSPNVVFVITDDQGYGDLGFTGNPIIQWTNRTGVWHTFFARAMMYEDEVTIADHFQAAGYATGMFG